MAALYTRSWRILRWSPQDGELVLREGRVSNVVQATTSPPLIVVVSSAREICTQWLVENCSREGTCSGGCRGCRGVDDDGKKQEGGR